MITVHDSRKSQTKTLVEFYKNDSLCTSHHSSDTPSNLIYSNFFTVVIVLKIMQQDSSRDATNLSNVSGLLVPSRRSDPTAKVTLYSVLMHCCMQTCCSTAGIGYQMLNVYTLSCFSTIPTMQWRKYDPQWSSMIFSCCRWTCGYFY